MERPKYFAIAAFFLWHTLNVLAQPSFQKRIYTAFISGDMTSWRETMDELAKTKPQQEKNKLQLLSYYYGYSAWLIGNDKESEAKAAIKKAEELIEEILRANPEQATALAFQGAFIGFKIGLTPFKAPFLGPKSSKAIQRALDIDPKNCQATIEFANALYYRPATFGGDKKLAIEYFERAASLFEGHDRAKLNWIYLNLLTVLAQAYEETEQPSRAKAVYEKILDIEPDYSWVRDELFPALLNTM